MPNSRRWQQSEASRGWAVHEDLQQEAWLRVLQGRRPPSVKWPWSDWEWSVIGGVCSPSHHSARSVGLRPFVDANIKKTEAGDRVQKLQQALNILGDTEGPEVDGLRAALKRAEIAAQGVPVDKQVKDCEAFLSRARAHLEELEQKRSVVAASINTAEQRLVILKMKQDCAPPPPPDTTAQVQRLQDLVSHLQAQVRGGVDPLPKGRVVRHRDVFLGAPSRPS